jgi:GTPase SAR1 family protein
LGKEIQTSPTIGSNFEQITIGNVELATHDLGGQDSLRKIWKNFYPGSSGLVFVVDSSDVDSLSIVKGEIEALVHNDHLKDGVFLILANK